jgi:hypothetical protein
MSLRLFVRRGAGSLMPGRAIFNIMHGIADFKAKKTAGRERPAAR